MSVSALHFSIHLQRQLQIHSNLMTERRKRGTNISTLEKDLLVALDYMVDGS